jgi:hypothetical protein
MVHATSTGRNFPLKRVIKVFLFCVVLVIVVGFIYLLQRHIEQVGRLSAYPNQACVGIGTALKSGVSLHHYDLDARSHVGPLFNTHSAPSGFIGRQTCSIGVVVTKQTKAPNGSSTQEGYELGATVLYFNSSQAAKNFAAKTLNLTHSWSVDAAGVKNNIPQTSLFTYIVTNTSEPYFDSYTIRDKAAVTLTLPCAMSSARTADQNFDVCNTTAQKVLKDFADTVQANLKSSPIF